MVYEQDPAQGLINTLEEFLLAIGKLPRNDMHQRLFRGQHEDLPLLPRLFRGRDAKAIQAQEEMVINAFKTDSPYLFPSRPDNDWDWLSLGQHFGLMTRLLDWSSNPLGALFFATERPNPTSPTVYAYGVRSEQILTSDARATGLFKPFCEREVRFFRPRHHSLRIAVQAGWHSSHTIGEAGITALHDLPLHRERIHKIKVAPENAKSIQRELELFGISHSTLYGDLPSLCASINSRYGFQD